MQARQTYSDKSALIVTKHGKEQVIQPLLKWYLGMDAVTSIGFDTDQFGTFSGDIARTQGPKETVRKKCLSALEQFSKTIGIATEGSFGAHPSSPFLAAHEEWMVFMDLENQLEIYERQLSTTTVQFAKRFNEQAQALDFLKTIDFPHQRVFIHGEEQMDLKAAYPTNLPEAVEAIQALIAQGHKCWITSDLRAHANPSRMKVIEEVTEKLIKRLSTCCPSCAAPGYGKEEVKRGLPCEQCHFPTSGIQADIYVCAQCGHREEKNKSDYPKSQNPMYCLICNP